MSYSFQERFTLIPQSPLIHFQWDQSGAALRATEVKPKLDRYIIKRYGKTLPDAWVNKKSPNALNYKLRFSVEGTPEPIKLGRKTDYDIYFANMNDQKESNKENEKRGILANNTMTVICFDDDLMKYIHEIIGDFFVVSNFGTMQDKGFGCFIVQDYKHSDIEIANLLRQEYGAKACYTFSVTSQKFIFRNIKTVHNILKAGNAFSPKVNSLLFEYFKDKNRIKLKSEKEWLHKRAKASESAYIRALMGISDHMGPVNRPTKISDANTDKDTRIERVPSPIWFIVYENKVFFVGRRIPDNLYGAKFNFESKDRKLNSGQLSVPSINDVGVDFIDRYLNYAVKRLQDLYFDRKLKFRVTEVKKHGK